MRFTVYGAGYLGLTTAVFLSANHQVTVVEIDKDKIDMVNQGESPIAERDLDRLLSNAVSEGKLKAVPLNHAQEVQDAILICVDTPSQEDGSVDLGSVESVVDSIYDSLKIIAGEYLIVTMRSTVPPGTTRTLLLDHLNEEFRSEEFGVVFQPEFLRQGHAIHDLLYPDRVIIGASSTKAFHRYKQAILPCIKRSNPPILRMSIESAELCKYMSNAFLATKISFVNEMAALAERLASVDIGDSVRGMVADHRICESHLAPGSGYGGSCLPKDVKGLIDFGRQLSVDMRLLKSVRAVNEHVTSRLLNLAKECLGDLANCKVAVLGLTFKAGTDDTRNSPSLSLIRALSKTNAEIHVHDPMAKYRELPNDDCRLFVFTEDLASCMLNSELAFLMTDWQEYENLGIREITRPMAKKCFIDARRMFVNTPIPPDIIYRPLGGLSNERET